MKARAEAAEARLAAVTDCKPEGFEEWNKLYKESKEYAKATEHEDNQAAFEGGWTAALSSVSTPHAPIAEEELERLVRVIGLARSFVGYTHPTVFDAYKVLSRLREVQPRGDQKGGKNGM
jgi:hypothetical protein